jgi:hypothetical protein
MTNNMFSLEKRKRGRVFCTWFLFTAKYNALSLEALNFLRKPFVYSYYTSPIKYFMYIMLAIPVKNAHELVFFTLNSDTNL